MVKVEIALAVFASLFLVGSFLVVATVYFDIDIPFLPNPALRDDIRNLQGQVSTLSGEVSDLRETLLRLNQLIEQQQDELNRLKIPAIVAREISASDVIIEGIAGEIINDLTDKYPGAAPAIIAGTNVLGQIIETKLNNPNVDLVSATRQFGQIYAAQLVFTFPVRLSELPFAAALVPIVGDVTFLVNVQSTATVDVATELVSNLRIIAVEIGI